MNDKNYEDRLILSLGYMLKFKVDYPCSLELKGILMRNYYQLLELKDISMGNVREGERMNWNCVSPKLVSKLSK